MNSYVYYLSCPICRCSISTWLRHNPNYSKLIIKRKSRPKAKRKITIKQQPKHHRETSKAEPTS